MAPPTQQPGSNYVKKVMISRTAIDLPEHRDLVKDACERQGMFPARMNILCLALSRSCSCHGQYAYSCSLTTITFERNRLLSGAGNIQSATRGCECCVR